MVYPKIYQGVIDFVEEATGKPFFSEDVGTPIKPHWIKDGSRTKTQRYICSYCREYAYNVPNKTTMQYKYCPNCGSEMLLERSMNNAEAQNR